MSIFYKFGVEAGDACNVECPGALDMSLADLKLAIVQQRNINNVTDYDLQIENSQSGKPYSVEEELIPRGTTVLVRRHILSLTPPTSQVTLTYLQVRRVPMPRGEKKTWQAEPKMERTRSKGGGEVSSLVVTSTSEEGRLDQVQQLVKVFDRGICEGARGKWCRVRQG